MTESLHTRATNEGPRRGAQNPQALLTAAAELFAEKGYDAPLYEVARRAGVGQGSLYRHFRGRESIVLALYGQNFQVLEDLAEASAERTDSFFVLLEALVQQVVDSLGYADALTRLPHEDVAPYLDRVDELFAGPIARAQAGGHLRQDFTAADLRLVAQMLYGVLRATPSEEREEQIRRALALLGLARRTD
ncbi:helix-turn-helix domain containing protein [Georgenia sp. 10Sc9-8]|uniref:Helix-turn-helix domain containing protein n=1 Tax=Georgenia halotolerans TaxID=3028317 RepID=A0ABT5TWS0_9MICO|nr:helix-turn-helix domain containing protein [Georgenia halotolerans]